MADPSPSPPIAGDTFRARLDSDLRDLSPTLFVSKRILEAVPHIFAGDQMAHIRWKDTLATNLGVDARALALVGSACVGCSLAPGKIGRSFGAGSDIDVAVISHYHFEVAWNFMRSLGSTIYRLPAKTQAVIRDHMSRLIYWGTIATDTVLPILPFAHEWIAAFDAMRRIAPTTDRDVKARIYRDFEALRAYQQIHISEAQRRLLTAETSS